MQTTTAGAAGWMLAVLLFAGCSDGPEPTRITPNPTAPTPAATALQYTLSGVVFETIAHEKRPRAGVVVQCEFCDPTNGGWIAEVRTDSTGLYFFTSKGPGTGVSWLYVELDEYRVVGGTEAGANGYLVEIPLNGNTRRDIEVSRR
jgi:hypothetical protein